MYEDLDDAALNAKIIQLRDAVEKIATPGGIAVIAGEGRRKEYTRGNSNDLMALYNAATNEREKRNNGGRLRGRALGVRFLR